MFPRLAQLLRSYRTEAGRRAAWNLFGLGACTILSQAALLGLMVFSADSLGPALFGSFIFALTLQNYLCLIGSAGAQPIVVRDAAAHPDRVDEITTSFFTVTGFSSLLVAACVIGGAFLAPLSAEERDVVLLFAVANIAASINLLPLFDMHHQQVRGAIGTTTADLLALAVVVVLARTGNFTLSAIGIVLASKWILGTLLQALLYHFTVRRLRILFSLRASLRLARSSLPILGSYFLCILPLSSGVFFLRFFQGPEATGIFGIACQASALTFAFAWLGIRVIQPHLSGEYGLNSNFIRKLIIFMTLFLLGLGSAAFLGGSLLIWIAFDPVYRAAIAPMGVLIAASAILSAGVVASLYLLRFHYERTILTIYIFTSAIYLTGCAILIPSQGIAGAAGMTLATALIGSSILIERAIRLIRQHGLSDPLARAAGS